MSLYVYMDKYVYICILYIINTCRCVLFYIYMTQTHTNPRTSASLKHQKQENTKPHS